MNQRQKKKFIKKYKVKKYNNISIKKAELVATKYICENNLKDTIIYLVTDRKQNVIQTTVLSGCYPIG